ncbi:aldehyde dehydrogenase family protein [Burkholderia cenocepacia]|uniref:aldehyde dehydrogenase family protein n=1 Tax=Burkholderia cenocepacia TaxID=95486 RepID=UPI0023B9CE9D|nr:aldehyde dehydrogenase family protein [Burkholderia cenocepacia]MDF0506819.1 aldehyde dehydrogenase family protein [Burkholderia cenocepacia]
MNGTTQSRAPSGAGFLHEYGQFIDGTWTPGDAGKTIDLHNPATGDILARIAAGNGKDAERAINAAAGAFPGWARTPPAARQEILYEIMRRLKARQQHYALMDTLNNGKPISESMHFDMPMAIEQFAIFSGAPWQLHGESMHHTSSLGTDSIGIVHREPLGVVVQIIPWNVPMIMLACKIAPALAAGNTIVLKPSEIVCLSVLEFAREMADLLPPGVLNIVTGYGPDLGEALVTDTRVRKVGFTGSRPTARKLVQYAAANIIPQTMELGGKSANIVCEDADLDAAAEGAAMSTVLNKGEVCLAGSRLFVHEKVRDAFLDKLQRILAGIRIGDPTSPDTQLGPQASRMQLDKILGYLEEGPREGARVLTGGGRASVPGYDNGLFIQPTVFVDVKNSMKIAQEEIFGPVTSVLTWKDDDEVVRLANASVYGLGGGIWTSNLARAHRMACALETGTVWINRYYNFLGGMPIGGYKQSGFGREFAREVLNHYTLTKSVIVDLQPGALGIFGARQ